MKEEITRADFHHACYAVIKFHFAVKGIKLEYKQEHELGEKPVRVDFIVINKSPDEKIINDTIGEFFKVVNIFEFKSPDDGLSIDDFFKVQAYGLLYKCIDRKVDELPITDMTITLLRDSYPREMIKALKKYNFAVTNPRSGVYNVDTGNFIPVRIMVMSQMSEEDRAELKLISRNFTLDDVKNFMRKAADSHDPNIIENAEAVLRVCSVINEEIMKKIKEDPEMNDVIIEIFGDLFEKDKEKAVNSAVNSAVNTAVADVNERVATDMLKRKYPLEAIQEISKLSKNAIITLAKNLGVSVVMS